MVTAAVLMLALVIVTVKAPLSAFAADTAPVDLGVAATYSVVGGETVTNTGDSILDGDLGLSPGSSITGFPPGVVLPGHTTHAADSEAAAAQAASSTAYDDAEGRSGAASLDSAHLGGRDLVAGVYKVDSTAELTGNLTLDGKGNSKSVWIFQIPSSLTTASHSNVSLTNGASACNVFWQVGSSATIGTDTHFIGTVLAKASITANTNAFIDGRLLAQTGKVSLDTNVFQTANCQASAAPTVTVTATPPTETVTGPAVTVTATPTATETVTGPTTTVTATSTATGPTTTVTAAPTATETVTKTVGSGTPTATETVTGPTTTVTGPTTTVTGPTTTVSGPTVTVTGPTTTVSGPTVTVTGPTTGPTVTETATPTVTVTGPTTGPTVTVSGPTTGPTVTETAKPTATTTETVTVTTTPTATETVTDTETVIVSQEAETELATETETETKTKTKTETETETEISNESSRSVLADTGASAGTTEAGVGGVALLLLGGLCLFAARRRARAQGRHE